MEGGGDARPDDGRPQDAEHRARARRRGPAAAAGGGARPQILLSAAPQMSAAGGPLLPPPAPPTDQQRADHEAGVLAARMRERFTTSRSSDAPAIAPPRPSALPKSVER